MIPRLEFISEEGKFRKFGEVRVALETVLGDALLLRLSLCTDSSPQWF